MLAWQLDGVGYGQESVTAIAADAEGMSEAIGTLYEMAAGLAPLTPLAQPTGAAITVTTKAPARVPTLPLAWQAQLADRAAAVKALVGGQTVILSQDGMLTLFGADGKIAWQKPLPHGGERWALDASADGGVIAVGASQYLLVFDNKGKQLCDVPIGTFTILPVVTSVAVSDDGSRIAAAGTNGCLTLFSKDGKRLWNNAGVDTATLATYAAVKETPVPYYALIFTTDGARVVAATESQAQVISLADGKVQSSTGGVNGRFPLLRSGTNVLASDGGHTVKLYSPTEGKVVKEMTLSGDGTVGPALQGESIFAGTESDSSVLRLKSLDGQVAEQSAWTHAYPCHIVKKVLAGNGATVVIYWGVLLQVLDAAGNVIAAQTLPQDVADAALAGPTLVAGLADGRVWALKIK